jgi:hypothetical protein
MGVSSLRSTSSDWPYQSAITFTQAAAQPWITFSQSELFFRGTVGEATVSTTANCDFSIATSHSWITATLSDDGVIHIAVTANTDYEDWHNEGGTDEWYREGAVYATYNGTTIGTIEIDQAPATITASTETLSFNRNAAKMEIEVTAEAAWTASSAESWIELSPSSGEAGTSLLSVHVTANSTEQNRTGYVVLEIAGETYSLYIQIPITQRGIYGTVAPESLSFVATGGTSTLKIESNTSWQLSSVPSWLTISQVSGSGNAELKVTAADNPSRTERSGTLLLVQEGVSKNITIPVKQSGKIFTVGETVLSFDVKASSQTVDITTDGKWSASTTDNWITLTPSSASGNSTLTVGVSHNTETVERQGSIKVVMGTEVSTINVVQQGLYLTTTINPTISSKGGSLFIYVSSNDTWNARVEKKEVTWLTVSGTGTDEGGTYYAVNVSDNPSVNSRTAAVLIEAAYHPTVRVELTQEARYLRIDATKVSFFAKGGNYDEITIDTDGTYSITCSGTWFSVKQTGNVFVVSATRNTAAEMRTGTITLALTDLKEGTYTIELPVVQTAEGASFLRQDYKEDVSYDEGASSPKGTITGKGYGNDQSWDKGVTPNGTLTIKGYGDDQSWDKGDTPKGTITGKGYGDDLSWDKGNTPKGTITGKGYGDDLSWDKGATPNGTITGKGYGDDQSWDKGETPNATLKVVGYQTEDTHWGTSKFSVTVTGKKDNEPSPGTIGIKGYVEDKDWNDKEEK